MGVACATTGLKHAVTAQDPVLRLKNFFLLEKLGQAGLLQTVDEMASYALKTNSLASCLVSDGYLCHFSGV